MRRLTATIGLVALVLGVTVAPAAADEKFGGDESGGSAGPGEISAWVGGPVGVVQIVSSGGGASCVYSVGDVGLPVFDPDPDDVGEYSIGEHSYVNIRWDCDGDGLIDGSRLVEVFNPQNLAVQAWNTLRTTGMPQPLVTTGPESVTSGFYSSLAVNIAWEPVSVSASGGPITSTVTAVPLRVEWDTGDVNAFVDRPTTVTCDGPGDSAIINETAPCRFWFYTSSAGAYDDLGTFDVTTLEATIVWEISWTANTGASNSAWFEFDQTTAKHGVPVNEVQVIITN